MAFSQKQVRALRRDVSPKRIRTRTAHGRDLSYIEGWYAIAEANRIFGFDGWDRETIKSRCVLARETRGVFSAVYVAKVRVTVRANGDIIVREGHGTGEGRGGSVGETHEIALKGAETDATKRALATFGMPFGLALYANGKMMPEPSEPHRHISNGLAHVERFERNYRPGSENTSSTQATKSLPAMRASRSIPFAQITDVQSMTDKTTGPASSDEEDESAAIVESDSESAPGTSAERSRIDKGALTFGQSPRRRDKLHLRFVASQPCLVCGRSPSDAHHLKFSQPTAIGRKVSDEFTVPLCRIHHRDLHHAGNEREWWKNIGIAAEEVARKLWVRSKRQVNPDTPLMPI